jgi:hypothetical protein
LEYLHIIECSKSKVYFSLLKEFLFEFIFLCLLSRICCKSTVSEGTHESTHEHPLHLRNSSAPYKCNGCKEIGFGSSYRCIESNCPGYQLHNECTSISVRSHTTHSLFSRKVNFIFHRQSPEHVESCVACGKDVKGFRYHYSPPKKNAFLEFFLPCKQLVLHPCCFSLSSNRTNQGLNRSNERVVKLELKKKAPSKCLICQRKKISKKVKGWAYVSTCGKYCYHVRCVKDLVSKGLKQQIRGTNTETLPLEVRQKALNVGQKIVEAVLMLIIQAIFGDPISTIVTLVLNFFTNEIC